MVSVLISINRPYTDFIVEGLKLWEIRKNKPKIPVPFRDYIYETKRKGGCGKVIGEFICDNVNEIDWSNYEAEYRVNHIELDKMCLNQSDLCHYGKGKNLYAWHISELKIYDVPKEIWEFKKPCIMPEMPYCPCCRFGSVVLSDDEEEYAMYHGGKYETCEWHCLNHLKRPFQSWGYVEEA